MPEDMQGVTNATVENDLDMVYFKNLYLPSSVSKEVVLANKRNNKTQMRSLGLLDHQNQPTMTMLRSLILFLFLQQVSHWVCYWGT